MRKLVIGISAALVFPAGAQAADYIGLTVNRTKVAPGWTLAATHTSGSFYRGDEIFGLTLRRSHLGGRGEEQHALRAHPKQPMISFDGSRGRWQTNGQLGNVAAVDMTIEATGSPTPVGDAWGCLGAFARVPVRLEGTLTLRTGTRFFKTIRRTRLAGFVTFDDGVVSCDPAPSSQCEASSSLYAGDPRASVLAAARNIVLQFRQAVGAAAWYHVMTAGGYDALTGSLPSIGIAAPTGSLIRGNARFVGGDATESSFGTCRTTRTNGAATGNFRTTFAGWGDRTVRLAAGTPASFSETH